MHFSKILQIFGGLVLGCIKTKFCKKICVWQHFSSSRRFAHFCTAPISKLKQNISLKNQQFSWKFSKILQMLQNLQNFAIFQKLQLDNLVDFEKCCKTRICLQRSVPIQPKTSNILPKFCRSAVVSPTGALDPLLHVGGRGPAAEPAFNILFFLLEGSFSAVSKWNLQENMRLKVLAEIYTMHSFAQLWNLDSVCSNSSMC